ncbi:MAG: hypothetical protein IKX18_05575 [Muribaculaceae bacterium]|nr:hypothetical protein [Muribaculaceae bacterium]
MDKINNFLKQYLKLNDSGKIFTKLVKPIYKIIGWAHVLLPLFLLKMAYEALSDGRSGMRELDLIGDDHKVILTIVFLLIFAVSCLVAYLAIKFWYDRAERLDVLINNQSEFCVLPIIVTFVRNLGEGLALVIAVMGVGYTLSSFLGLLMLSVAESDYFKEIIKTAFTTLLVGTIGSVIVAYVTLVFHRFLSESIGLMVSVASNVSRIANKN